MISNSVEVISLVNPAQLAVDPPETAIFPVVDGLLAFVFPVVDGDILPVVAEAVVSGLLTVAAVVRDLAADVVNGLAADVVRDFGAAVFEENP